MIVVNGETLSPTVFPDATSQVWKLSDGGILPGTNYVHWVFNEEAELVHLLQLCTLIRATQPEAGIQLYCPYLPYARQDKDISNDATFALHTFLSLIALSVDDFVVFDPHSRELLEEYFVLDANLTIIEPKDEINKAIVDSGADILCYPDKGASTRYPFLKQSTVVMDLNAVSYSEADRESMMGEMTLRGSQGCLSLPRVNGCSSNK